MPNLVEVGTRVDVGPLQAGMQQAAQAVQGSTVTIKQALANLADANRQLGAAAAAGSQQAIAAIKQYEAELAQAQAAANGVSTSIRSVGVSLPSMTSSLGTATRSLTQTRLELQAIDSVAGIRVPRALTTMAAKFEGLAPIISAAFPAFAAIFLIEQVIKLSQKFHELSDSAQGWTKDAKNLYKELVDENTKLYLSVSSVADGSTKLIQINAQLNPLYQKQRDLQADISTAQDMGAQGSGLEADAKAKLVPIEKQIADLENRRLQLGPGIQQAAQREADEKKRAADQAARDAEALARQAQADADKQARALQQVYKSGEAAAQAYFESVASENDKHLQVLTDRATVLQKALDAAIGHGAFIEAQEFRTALEGVDQQIKSATQDAMNMAASLAKGIVPGGGGNGGLLGSILSAPGPAVIGPLDQLKDLHASISEQLELEKQKEFDLQIAAQGSVIGQLRLGSQIRNLRKEELADLQNQLAKMKEIALATGDPKQLKAVEQLTVQIDKLKLSTDQWASVAKTAAQSFNSNLVQILSMSESVGQGIQRMLQQVLQSFLQVGIQWVENWALSAIGIKATDTLSSVNQVTHSAAVAAARAYAAYAEFPPIAAAAAAGAEGAVLGFLPEASYDQGGIVPRDQIARVHEGEGVLSNPMMDLLRSAIGTGGHSFNITLHGSASQDDADRIVAVIKRAIRHGKF